MKKLALMLIILCLISLCGCATYREIDRGYLVTAIGFKRTNENVSIALEAISSPDANDTSSQKATLVADGKTINDAYFSLRSQLVKPLYFEQLGAVVIADSFARDNFAEIIDFCTNLQSASLGMYVVSTPDLQTLFSTQTPDGILGYDIIGLIKNYETTGGKKDSCQLYQLRRQPSSAVSIAVPVVSVQQEKLILSSLVE